MFKRNNNRKGLIFILIFVFVFIIVSNISLIKLIKIPSDFYVSYDEIDRANKEDLFGNFVELKLKENEIKTGKTKVDEGEIEFKLFENSFRHCNSIYCQKSSHAMMVYLAFFKNSIFCNFI